MHHFKRMVTVFQYQKRLFLHAFHDAPTLISNFKFCTQAFLHPHHLKLGFFTRSKILLQLAFKLRLHIPAHACAYKFSASVLASCECRHGHYRSLFQVSTFEVHSRKAAFVFFVVTICMFTGSHFNSYSVNPFTPVHVVLRLAWCSTVHFRASFTMFHSVRKSPQDFLQISHLRDVWFILFTKGFRIRCII